MVLSGGVGDLDALELLASCFALHCTPWQQHMWFEQLYEKGPHVAEQLAAAVLVLLP